MSRAAWRAVAAAALVTWFAVALQVALVIATTRAAQRPLGVALANTFSFFTITTNLLVAVVLTATALRRGFDHALCRPGVLSAVASYIAVVALIYEALLRPRWTPVDVALVSDFLLHDVVPIVYVVLWASVVPKGTLRAFQPLRWLAYPVLYVVYTTARGAITGWYPYFFIDIATLGYRVAFTNAAAILVFFLLVGLVVVAADRALARRARS